MHQQKHQRVCYKPRLGLLLLSVFSASNVATAEAPYPRVASYHQGTTDYTDMTEAANAATNDWIVLHWHPAINKAQMQTWIQALQSSRLTLRPTRAPTKVFLYTIRDSVSPASSYNALRAEVQEHFLWAAQRTIGTLGAGQMTRSGSTVTVNTPTSHNLAVGHRVAIYGANQSEYNSIKQVATIVDSNTFTFTVSGTPATPATGTISVRGPVPLIFNNPAVNECPTEIVASGLTWVEWDSKYVLDNWGASTNLDIDGLMFDNFAAMPLISYDFDRNGTNDSATNPAFKQALQAARERQVDYVKSRGYLTCANSSIKKAVTEYWTTSVDDRQIVKLWGVDFHVLELVVGQWNSPEGVGFYDGDSSTNLSQLRTWPGNATFSATPPIGTPFQSTFGRYFNSATPPTTNIGVYNLLKLVQEVGLVPDQSRIAAQVRGPAPDRIGSWTGAAALIRYAALLPQVMTPFATDYLPQNNGAQRKTVRLDEFEFEWGQPLAPPQTIADEIIDGVNMREFEHALVLIYHRRGTGSSETFTSRQVILPPAGPGKKWQRINAASFFHQDPATNNGVDAGATHTFSKPRDAIVYRRVNL